jgi:alkylated DNA repair protein alkB homolog 6
MSQCLATSEGSFFTMIDYKKLYQEERQRRRHQSQGEIESSVASTSDNERDAAATSHIPTGSPDALPPTRTPCEPILSRYRLPISSSSLSYPRNIFHVPNLLIHFGDSWVGPLVQWLDALPDNLGDPEDPHCAHGRWTRLRHAQRRVALFDGTMGLPSPIFEWAIMLSRITADVRSENEECFYNHVLINEYDATQGIMPHTDGPSYEPHTATLSLGFPVVLHFDPMRKESSCRACSVVLTHGSLIVFTDNAYSHFTHGIHPMPEETATAMRPSTSPLLPTENYWEKQGQPVRMLVDRRRAVISAMDGSSNDSDLDPLQIMGTRRISLTFRRKK